MRVLKIVPGTGGGFLCENCLRDQSLVAELRWAGHDVLLIPLYLPIAGAPTAESVSVPLFYGAIRIYLEHRFPFFRRFPDWFRRRLDSPRMLLRAASRASTSSSANLADLTLSVLRGENGDQARDLDALCLWLQDQPRPDVVHISNALLLGLARKVAATVKAPVVCSLQDEDTWIDAMPSHLATRAWAEIRARVPDVTAFIASSHFFAAKMPRRMGMPLRNVRAIHPGIDLAPLPFQVHSHTPPVWGVLLDADDTVGLSRICTAYLAIRSNPACSALKLRISGLTPSSAAISSITTRGLSHEIEFLSAFSRHADRLAFLKRLSLLTVLHLDEPAFDLSLLEAMAIGVPVVQPNTGANPEILGMAEGGLLFDPDRAESIVLAITSLLIEPRGLADLARRGRRDVEQQFSLARMARETVDVYQAACATHQPLRQRKPSPAPIPAGDHSP